MRNFGDYWQRPCIDLCTRHVYSAVGRLPTPAWCWAWNWNADGISTPLIQFSYLKKEKAGANLPAQSLVAAQNALAANQIPMGMAFMIFCQNFAGASLVVAATAIFGAVLTTEIQAGAPSVSPAAALAAGASASAVRALVPAGSPELEGLLLAFSNAINHVFYLCVGCSIVVFLTAWGMGWVDTRRKKTPASTAA
jgi:hypothetical protein